MMEPMDMDAKNVTGLAGKGNATSFLRMEFVLIVVRLDIKETYVTKVSKLCNCIALVVSHIYY